MSCRVAAGPATGCAGRFDGAGHLAGGFGLDQREHRGRWVDGPAVRVTTGMLVVTVAGAGSTRGVAASAARVTCEK
jgi:hypothetical protein